MDTGNLRDILRRAFLAGYDCGRADEQDDKATARALPDNDVVSSLDEHRDLKRKEA